MKHRLLSLVLIMSCLVTRAEFSHILSSALSSDQDYHFTANSHIVLDKGFKADPKDGHEVLLDIDTYAMFPPTGGVTGGPSSNNTNGVVGTLGGIVDVSQLGGAVYTIPIDLPTGLGGMKPQLSISYNNQSKNGLLGWNWNLGGISSITRTGGTRYHDGYISAVNYTDDRFCLDGNRLMNVTNSSYGSHGCSYRTEIDQQSKITSFNESGINGPAYFEVRTADGNIFYYGNTNDSKALKDSQNHVNVWLLNHVEDRNGNSMDYHYIIEPNSYRLDRIDYSGNSNNLINPTFTVEFLYSDREDVEIHAVGEMLCKMDKKLDKIRVYNGETLMYTYLFNYQTPTPSNGLPYHLLTSIKFYADQEHFNPTRIQWGSNNYNAISGNELKCQVTTNGITDAFLNAVKFSGDFNGDGYTDVLTLQPNNNGSYSTANLFVNKGISGHLTFDYAYSFTLKSNVSWIQVADFNGDGLDDILISNRIRNPFPFPDQIDTEIYFCRILSSGNLGFDKQNTPLCFVSRNAVETHLVGDFLGDGGNTILVQSSPNGKTLEKTQLFRYNEATGDIQLHQFPETLNDTRLFAADYDGDGITEILYKKANGNTAIVKIKENNGMFHYEEIFNETMENWDDCFNGDFNGDGLTDVLFYTANATNPWKIHLLKGSKINGDSYELPNNFPYSSPGNYLFSLDQPNHTIQYIKTGDFDGNGSADLALYKDNLFYVFYGPLKEGGSFAPFTNCQKINAQAFGLYDNMDVCLGNFTGQERLSYLGHNTVSRLPSMRLRHEVKTITDGMGRKTEFTYDYLSPNLTTPSENDFYRLTRHGLDHFSNVFYIAVPLRGLKKVTTYNINNKPVVMQCYYENALLHKYGKGFLGFSKTRQDDYCNNQLQKQTRKQYDIACYNDIIHYALDQEEVYDPNGHLTARSTYLNDLYVNFKNNMIYIPMADRINEEFDVDHPERLIKKEFLNTYVNRNCSQLHKYDGALSIASQIKGTTGNAGCTYIDNCEFKEIRSTTYRPNNYNSWLINMPDTVTSIIQREGNYNDICHRQVFSYVSGKPHLVKTILDLPNDGSHPEDRLAKKTEFQYDPVGNIISKTISTPNDNVASRRETFEYSTTYGRRLLTKHTDALGQASVFSYDPVYNYRTSMTDCNGLTTHYEQDPLGITCMTYFPDGTQTCKATRWSGSSYYQWQKKSGQATEVKSFALTGEPITERGYDLQGNMVFTKMEYDNLGRLSKKSLPYILNGTPTYIQYQYDGFNRINRIIHPDGSYETLQYDTNSKSTTFFAKSDNTQTESKTFNVMGWVIRSTDAEGNSVVYDYRADGKPLSAQMEGYDETLIEMDYDGLGHRISLSDPNYGLITYEYNAFDEICRQTSPKTDETVFSYDALGRMVSRKETNHLDGNHETTEWHYGTTAGRRGLLTKIITPHHTIHYNYDSLLRLKQTIETFDGRSYQTSYSYDAASRVANIRYPSNYAVTYSYTSEGYLKTVMNEESDILWKTLETNASTQPIQYRTGNGFVTQNNYDNTTQRLLSIQTVCDGRTIQNYAYCYDDFANITSRNDLKQGIEEHFEYDCLNRLTQVEEPRGNSQFRYDALGRMLSKTTPEGIVFSNADYSGEKPHALKAAHTTNGVFSQNNLNIEYNSFDKVNSINGENVEIQFEYGYDHQRIKMTENIHGITRVKTYINGCEFIETPDGEYVRTFLSGPLGVFAVAETTQGQTSLHYIHKDHLGSWTVISDSEGNIEQEHHFDPWGNCENPDEFMFERGFTGHEHIHGVNLINMNGRLYDPVTSSMLSPDNNIQMPDFTQNLNRYSYCLNNPLSYTDPDGNTFIESALLFYFLYCTDFGYEYQKHTSAFAFHFDFHLSSQQIGFGFDFSFGLPKSLAVSYRYHIGATFYGRFYDHSFTGLELRQGGEWCIGGWIGYSGTTFLQGKRMQTTNAIILGTYMGDVVYENDYMFNLSKYIPLVPAADNGDRYRSAAARIRFGLLSVGVNLFTGDPGVDHDIRRTFNDPDANGRETYTISANGDDPNEYRAGVFYVGFGPIKIGANSEQIRNIFQNKFAHDFLCKGDSPYFKVLDRPKQGYFYFGTETGNTLW